jgi:hypothetical protein
MFRDNAAQRAHSGFADTLYAFSILLLAGLGDDRRGKPGAWKTNFAFSARHCKSNRQYATI